MYFTVMNSEIEYLKRHNYNYERETMFLIILIVQHNINKY